MDKKNTIAGSITGLIALFATFTFLFIGFTTHVWHPTWLVFLVVPCVSTIADIICKKKDVTGTITGIVSFLCTVVYLYMGFFLRLWHPGWLIFFAVPITGIIVGMFVKKTPEQDKDSNSDKCC